MIGLSPIEQHTLLIRNEALRLGFSHCGFSKAEFLEEEAPRLEKWLGENLNGKMSYMERNFDKRLDPTLLVPGAKTVVSLLYNYYQQEIPAVSNDFKLSKYAYGEDYHKVVKDKLYELLVFILDHIGEVNGRAFVDSAPVLEKAWAVKSGLGWHGKNGNIIRKGHGSYFFLAELIIDLPLLSDGPVTDHCGACTACMDACPTQAIYAPHQVDGSRCISYLTIELKDEIPSEFKNATGNWIFGCDVCMDVCPWNRFAQKNNEPRFNPNDSLMTLRKEDLLELTQGTFDKVFKGSAVERAGYNGLKRNIDFLLNS